MKKREHMSSVKDHIKQFLAAKVKVSANELDDATEVYSSGTFSSLIVLELLSYLEKTFDVEIGAQDLNQENFTNVKTISGLVERLLAQKLSASAE